MAPKADTYDAEATKRTEIPHSEVMEDAGKIHLGKYRFGLSMDDALSFLVFEQRITHFISTTIYDSPLSGLGQRYLQ